MKVECGGKRWICIAYCFNYKTAGHQGVKATLAWRGLVRVGRNEIESERPDVQKTNK